MKLQQITDAIEKFAPLALQESYDNAGLIVGNHNMEITGILICVDITESVINEAIDKQCNLIVAHHPIIFKGIKRLNGQSETERCVAKAIKNDIALYAAHTNLDNAFNGVSWRMAEKLNLKDIKVLSPKTGMLTKLVTFAPTTHIEKLQEALFAVGGGNIGNYSSCSFSHPGTGTFKAGEDCHPFCGEIGEIHYENESRLEIILPNYLIAKAVQALISTHPYEEPAIDLIPLENRWNQVGAGVVGRLSQPVTEEEFLNILKQTFGTPCIKHSALLHRPIKKVALCGGSGADFIADAKRSRADIYVTADVTYHRFAEANNELVIADIGHFESEQHTKEIIKEQLIKNFPNFAIHLFSQDGETVFYS